VRESLKRLSITGFFPIVGFADSKTCVAKFAVVVPKAGLSKYLMHLQEDYWTL
jgi:hypothetical protein